MSTTKHTPGTIQEIPEWVNKYNDAGHQSSAGKAVKVLIDRSKELEALNADLLEALELCLPVVSEHSSKAYFAALEAIKKTKG